MTPDAQGNFKGMSVPASAWERIFARKKWLCPKCGEVGLVVHESHSQIPYCVECQSDVSPV